MPFRIVPISLPASFSGCLSALAVTLALLAPPSSLHAAPRKAAKAKSAAAVTATARPSSVLDTGTVRRHYLDGDFDPAIALLEATLKQKPEFTHDDSVFIFKHLGVMYAAKYDTREKGKHYMHRLLEVEPTARILDMYASDMIYMIFKNIQDEFEAARSRLDNANARLGGGSPENRPKEPDPRPKDSPKESTKKEGSSAAMWIGATAAVAVAAGAATYFYFSDEPEKTIHEPALGSNP